MTTTSGAARAWGRDLSWWTAVNLLYLMAITVTGAAVRLTSSGLGCSDWPTCEQNSPIGEADFHAFVEFGNRVISGLAIIPVIAAYVAARRARPDLLPWVWLLVAGFIGQVLLGMAVTRAELDPRVVLGHFLLSIVLVGLACGLHHGATGAASLSSTASLSAARLRALAATMVVLSSAVIVAGTFVTGSGPHTGSDESEEPIPRLGFDVFDVVRVHSVLVWVLVAAILYGLWQLRAAGAGRDSARSWLLAIAGLGIVQGAVGYVQYFTGVPTLLVGLHVAGSVLFWTAVVLFALRVRATLDGSGRTGRRPEAVIAS